MPLRKGYSRSIISSNIRELHTGATFAHTEGKFGKKRADKQAVAIALDTARKSKRRRRADGGSLWGDIGGAMPESYGADSPIMDPLVTVPKRLLWDLPHEAVDAAANAPPVGMRREDYTDTPEWGPPDPTSMLGRVGISAPTYNPDRTTPLIKATTEAATNVMGGTALSAPAEAGEAVLGAGPRMIDNAEALREAANMRRSKGWATGKSAEGWDFRRPDPEPGTPDRAAAEARAAADAAQPSPPSPYMTQDDIDFMSGPTFGAGANDQRAAGAAGLNEVDQILAREKASAAVPQYPLAPRGEWYGDANFDATGGQMTTMSPDEFLAKARPMQVDDVARENIDDLKSHIGSGKTLDPLALYKNGKEDGRHRAHAAKELGIKEVPVLTWPKDVTLGAGANDERAAGAAGLDELDQILAREKAGATHEPAPTAGAEGPAAADPGEVGPGGGGSAGARSLPEAQAAAARWAGTRTPLEGLPGPMKIGDDYFVPGPIGKVHDVAEQYMRENRPEVDFKGADKVHPIDPEHSQAIAQAYDEMKHSPKDPATKASYDALINETQKQYQAIKDSGLKIEPIPPNMPDPYAANPRLAAKDVAENNHLWFFPTENGFGTLKKISDNPMLRKTGEKIGDHEMLANDMFRVVHDYFGHLQHGHGFRAMGEDNAWRSHSAMYSDLARPAMTTETRGQNSWVNYGPHGEANRTASGANTVYADQKVGLMPDWTMYDRGKEPIYAYHGSPHSFDRFSMDKIGSGEGAQAYGHGLYFAENPKVAKAYRDQLSANQAYEMNGEPLPWTHVSDMFWAAARKAAPQGLHPDQAGQIVSQITNMMERGKSVQTIRKNYDPPAGFEKPWNAVLDLAEREKIKYNTKPGHSYKVAIEANPEDFIDWHAPMSKQGPRVRAVMGEVRNAGRDTGMQRYQEWAKDFGGDPAVASKILADAGVKGIKYLDQGSRNLAQGAKSHNYVAFNDKTIRILRKYGIAGLPGVGAAAGAMRDDQQRASGGGVNKALEVARRIKRAKGGAVHVGPIVGNTGGRADEVPMEVPDGAYIFTADHVSGLGEGNTAAGMKKLARMFPKSKPSLMRKLKGKTVPIYAAHGEFCASPEDIKDRFGDLDHGHRVLDHWQTSERAKLVDTLKGLDPPAQD